MEEIRNLGVILGRRPEDYIAGAASPIQFEERLPSGDWTPYLPSGERQSSRYADSMACVSFSAINSLETQIKFLTGAEENYSDRFLAKESGTTTYGNYLYIVADTVRKIGLPLELDWPAPPDFTWDSYYTTVPTWVKERAPRFLEKYDVKYEWLPDTQFTTIMKHLKHSPIQVVIPGHAVMSFHAQADLVKYFDTYVPYEKQYTSPFQAALKYVLTIKQPTVNYELKTAGKDIYMIKDGKKNMFINAHTFSVLDGRWDQVKKVTQAELDAIPDGDVLVAVPQE